MQARRVALSLVVGAVVGFVVAGLVGIPRLVGPASLVSFLSNAFTFWGLVFGTVAAVVTAGVTFAILNRRDRKVSRWGRIVAAVALAVLAAGTWWWIVMWSAPLFTLEGLWLYPLAIASTAAAVTLLRPRRPGAWDEPPGA